jgi:hypothetical protein
MRNERNEKKSFQKTKRFSRTNQQCKSCSSLFQYFQQDQNTKVHFFSVFEIGGQLSLLSQHLLNFQCLIEGSSDASVFYLTRTLWAILPLMIVVGCILTWSIIAVFGTMCGGKCCCKCSKDLFYYEIFNPYERIKLSCVTILYFIYPTLVQETFNLMSCRKGKQMK